MHILFLSKGGKYYRGGASKASRAICIQLAGARDICMYVCIYVYMHQALGLITLSACTNVAESAIFEILTSANLERFEHWTGHYKHRMVLIYNQ